MNGLPILTYHALDDWGSIVSTSPARFAATLRELAAEGFTCVDLGDWVARGRPHVHRGFALAFDDGLASIRLAADTLALLGFTATAFLVTGRMGRSNAWAGQPPGVPLARLIGWHHLEDLHQAGFRFGAHTETHPHLGRCDWGTIVREILGSRREIEARTGETCRLFAYPYGEAPPAAIEVVSAGFAAGFGTSLGYASGLARTSLADLACRRLLPAKPESTQGSDLRSVGRDPPRPPVGEVHKAGDRRCLIGGDRVSSRCSRHGKTVVHLGGKEPHGRRTMRVLRAIAPWSDHAPRVCPACHSPR